jgi:hypothetical protein
MRSSLGFNCRVSARNCNRDYAFPSVTIFSSIAIKSGNPPSPFREEFQEIALVVVYDRRQS